MTDEEMTAATSLPLSTDEVSSLIGGYPLMHTPKFDMFGKGDKSGLSSGENSHSY